MSSAAPMVIVSKRKYLMALAIGCGPRFSTSEIIAEQEVDQMIEMLYAMREGERSV